MKVCHVIVLRSVKTVKILPFVCYIRVPLEKEYRLWFHCCHWLYNISTHLHLRLWSTWIFFSRPFEFLCPLSLNEVDSNLGIIDWTTIFRYHDYFGLSALCWPKCNYISQHATKCTTNWHFEKWLRNTLQIRIIRFKKLTTIVLDWKNITPSFVRRKCVSTSEAKSQQLLLKHSLKNGTISSGQLNIHHFLPSNVIFMNKGTLCLPIFSWWRLVLCYFNPKQLLKVSWIWWCLFAKCSLTS